MTIKSTNLANIIVVVVVTAVICSSHHLHRSSTTVVVVVVLLECRRGPRPNGGSDQFPDFDRLRMEDCEAEKEEEEEREGILEPRVKLGAEQLLEKRVIFLF